MTPYHIAETYIDLDAVLMIDQFVSDAFGICGEVWLRDLGRISIPLGSFPIRGGVAERTQKEAQTLWNAFLAAWKRRATERMDPLTGRPESAYKQHIL